MGTAVNSEPRGEAHTLSAFYTPSSTSDICDAYDLANLKPHISQWGHLDAEAGERIIRVVEDSGTFTVYLFTHSYVLCGEASIDGDLATPVMLAAVLAAVRDRALEVEAD